MHSTLFSPADPISDTHPPSSSIDTPSGSGCGESHREAVGLVPHGSFTSAEREAAIKLAGDLVVKYMRYANDNPADYFTYRGMADRARLSMEALIKGRSADWKRQA